MSADDSDSATDGSERRIRVGETADGADVTLPVVEMLTGRGFVTGKSGSGKSILEGTPVHTENGRKPIEDVEEGERVLSLNKHTYEQEFREVQATIEHADDRLLRITLEDGTELVGTEDHSFLTVDRLEIVPIRGAELEEGTWMPLSRSLPSADGVTEVDLAEYAGEANNVRVDGGVIQSGPRREERHLSLDFPTGKEVGLYLAEGSFDSGQTLQISNVDDDVHEFLDAREYNVYERTCNKGFRPYARFLESEFGRGAGEKSIPNWAFDAPAEFRAGLLSGYFDGDGTVGENNVTAMSKSEALVDGLRELLRQFGISTTVRDKFTLYDGEERRFRRLTVDSFCVAEFDEIVDLSVESKRRRLGELSERLEEGDRYNSKDLVPNFGPVLNAGARNADWTARESDRRVDGASVHNLTRQRKAGRRTYNRLVDELGIEGRAKDFGESDVQWKRVVSVEELDEERTVYDLDVELNDNFVANGVFVHNSNSASVVVEELLETGFPVLIVDTDGEYYGLKESYELLHAGADEECDIQVSAEHAEKLAALALEQNVPIILDVSGYLDEDEADELLRETARHLFAKEKKLKKPFLLVVEECHEYIPEGGGMGETGKMLIKVGKRGRKHGLGIVGISQRPADVKKDFITQANWLVWHRLTWENDTKVVGRIVGGEYGDRVADLDAGEAFVQTDWTDGGVRRVQFKRKRTFDAGATPGLDDFERPDLKSVSDALVDDIADITDEKQREEDRVAELEAELGEKEERITDLQRQLREARDVSSAARQMADALVSATPSSYQSELPSGTRNGEGDGSDADDATGGADDEKALSTLQERVAELEAALDRADGDGGGGGNRDVDHGRRDAADAAEDAPEREDVDEYLAHLREKGERLRAAAGADEEAAESGRDSSGDGALANGATGAAEERARRDAEELASLVEATPVAVRIEAARRQSQCNERHARQVLDRLLDGPATVHDLAASDGPSVEAAHTFLSELRARSLVTRDDDRRYAFDADAMARVVEGADERASLGELREQWRVE